VRAFLDVFRRVDNHVDNAPLTFHRERRLAVLFAEPALMPKFACGHERVHVLGAMFDVRERLRRRGYPMRKLEQPSRTASATSSRKASLPETAATWAAYSEAYAARYGVEPIRNGTVNSQMVNFVKRVGMVEAPEIARFYVSHNNRFYVQHMHFVGSMLQDAEKLRTEWVTRRQMTSTEAAQADRTAANFNAMAPLFAEARAQEQQVKHGEVNHAKHRTA
jgi:hypothetical protein